MKARLIHVLVKRDMAEEISTITYAHALPILQEIHGEENITVIGDSDQPPVDLNPAEEYGRLETLYRLHESGVSHVERVYGRFIEKQFVAAVEALNIDAPADVDNAEDENAKLTVPEIKAKLDELGIEYDAKAKKEDLLDLLNQVTG